MSDLFPNAQPAAASRLLRTTLYYLRRMLGTVIRSDHASIALSCSLTIEHDVGRFESGTAPGTTLTALVAAIEEYRGVFLGAPSEGWGEQEAQRLYDRYVDALRRGTVLARAHGDDALELVFARKWTSAESWDEDAHAAHRMALRTDGASKEGSSRSVPPTVAHPEDFDWLPLSGRDTELQRLGTLWTEAQSGQARVLIVEGVAGIGKTRLLQAWAASEQVAGSGLLFWGVAHEQTANRPLGLMLDVLARASSSERLALEHAWAMVDDLTWSALVLDMPTLQQWNTHRSVIALPRLEQQAEELRRLTAWTTLLDALCSQAPVTLVLENVHQADTETLGLIEMWNAAPRPLLAVLTRRPSDVEDDVTLPRLTLTPLDQVTTEALFVTALGDSRATDLHARLAFWSGGVPLFAREILQTLAARQVLRWEAQIGWTTINERISLPDGVIELLVQRLAPLSSAARELAQLLAVLGRPVDDALLQLLTTDMAAREELLRHYVLRAYGGTGDQVLWFGHDWLAETLLATLDLPTRQRTSQRIAEALTAMEDADPGETMRHWASAGIWSAALTDALAAARRALAEMRLPTLDNVLTLAERAMQALDTMVDDEWHSSLLLLRESYLALAEQGTRWREHLEIMAKSDIMNRDVGYRAELFLRRGMAMLQQGHEREAEQLLVQAATLAHEAERNETESKAYFGLAQLLDNQNEDLPGVLAACEAAARAASALPDQTLYYRMMLGVAYAHARNGQPEQGMELLDALIAIPECAEQPALRGRAERYRGFMLKELRRYERAIAAQRRSVREFESVGDQPSSFLSYQNLQLILCEAGQYDGSRAVGMENLARARRLGDRSAEAGIFWYLALADFYSDEHESAWKYIQNSIALTETLASPVNLARMLQLGALIGVGTGRRAEARAAAERSLAIPLRSRQLAHFLNPMVLLQLGEPSRAHALATEILAAEDPRTLGNIFNLQDYWDAASVIARFEGEVLARPWQEQAYTRFLEDLGALEGVAERHSFVAATPANRAMAYWRSRGPRRLVFLPLIDVPGGRALRDDEFVPVVWTLHADDDPVGSVARRRRQLMRLAAEAVAQQAVATVQVLADTLNVAPRTILRDLQFIRGSGVPIITRASGTREP